MSRLIWIHSVCPLVFDFTTLYSLYWKFFKLSRRNYVVCFFCAFRINQKYIKQKMSLPCSFHLVTIDTVRNRHLISCSRHLLNENTGRSGYLKLAYLKNTIYVEVILHSQTFVTIFYFIFTMFMFKTRLSQNYGYIEVIFHSR